MKRSEIDDLILKRLCKWAKGGKAPPVRMTLLLTNRCDLKCLFCRGAFASKSPEFYKNELTAKEWISIVREAAKFGVRHWTISGGEPLMRAKTTISVIKTIKKLIPESIIELSTNGSFLTAEIAEKLVRYGCDRIEVGLDGPDAKTHDFLRGKKGSFEKVINAVEQLVMMKRKFNKEKPIIMINTVLNSENYDKLLELVHLSHSLGANFFRVFSMRIYDENRNLIEKFKLGLNNRQKRQVNETWKKIEKLTKPWDLTVEKAFQERCEEISDTVKYKLHPREVKQSVVDISSSGHLSNNSIETEKVSLFLSAFCFIPFYSLTIDGFGNVSPCSSIPATDFIDSNNLRTKNIKEVWYGEVFNKLREDMMKKESLSTKCKTCGMLSEREKINNQLSILIQNTKYKKRF